MRFIKETLKDEYFWYLLLIIGMLFFSFKCFDEFCNFYRDTLGDIPFGQLKLKYFNKLFNAIFIGYWAYCTAKNVNKEK